MASCPRCPDQQLTLYPVDQVQVDFCASCQGLWCDPGELEALLGEVPDPGFLPLPFGDPATHGLPCPVCKDVRLTRRQTATDPPIDVRDCRQCGGTWLDGGALPLLRGELAQRRRQRRPVSHTLPGTTGASVAGARAAGTTVTGTAAKTAFRLDDQLPYDNLWINMTALPAAFLVAFLLNLTPAVALLYPFLLLVHELGHALTAWLAGYVAVPLPIGLTAIGGERAPVLGVLVFAALVFLAWWGWRERKPIFTLVMAGFLALHLYLTWGVSDHTANQWITFGGLGAEIALSTLVICAYYYHAPRRLRWDFWRYVVLIPFAGTFVFQCLLWQRVRENIDWLPAGSAMTGTRDGSSDIDKLILGHGWTTEDIISTYEWLALSGIAILAAHYVWFLIWGLNPYNRKPTGAPPEFGS